ncbi:MAG: ATP-binding protein [Terrimesophilobacter sp.]
MRVPASFRRVLFSAPTPFLKQAPIAAFFVFALVVVTLVPESFVTIPFVVNIAMGLALVATIFALYYTHHGIMSGAALVVPALDLLALGFLRVGTGATTSAFSALVILPVVWLAMEHGRRFVVYAALGGAIALLMPVAFNLSLLADPSFMVRSLVTPVVYAIVAIVVNSFSRLWQERMQGTQLLADERLTRLEESLKNAEELAASEARLAELERMFRGLWYAVTEQSIIGTDRTGKIDAWNPGAEKMLGFLDTETEGIRRIEDFHDPIELASRSKELNYPAGETVLNPGFSALVEETRMGSADVREWTYVAADGSRVPVELAVTQRFNEAGETIGYLFVANDVTKAKELARLKDEFVGLISHELRTPLSSIIGYLELLRDEDGVELSANQLRYLSVAERNAQRLLGLVGDLLFTAQVDSGVFRVNLTEQHLDHIVSASVESARPAADSASVTLTLDIKGDAVCRVDALRIGQACDNLISNALKFTPRGGNVTVTVTSENDWVVVEIRDTGMGIASAELDKLFSRFFRASTATRNAVPGVGLGLVITKAIVTAHGGELGVTSEEGKGTCFRMALPRHLISV